MHALATDGYKNISLDDKKYFANTPNGWQRLSKDKQVHYRSIDGAYYARVWAIEHEVPNGVEWLNAYIKRGQSSGLVASAGAVSTFKAGRYTVATVRATFGKHSMPPGDLYVRYGGYSKNGDLFLIENYDSGNSSDRVTKFIEDVD